ncbi:hypothetical protein FF1_045033 [Malus domestica]
MASSMSNAMINSDASLVAAYNFPSIISMSQKSSPRTSQSSIRVHDISVGLQIAKRPCEQGLFSFFWSSKSCEQSPATTQCGLVGAEEATIFLNLKDCWLPLPQGKLNCDGSITLTRSRDVGFKK